MPTHQTTYNSRRSPVLSTGGMVATSQPLAAQAGLNILREGGNAADAAVAVAAVLNVVEPMWTGIGGDCFALYFDAKTKQVTALNGSGRAPQALALEDLRAEGYTRIPARSAHAVTVPGTVRGWEDLLARHGRMTLAEVLRPAMQYAERGYPVSPLVAQAWQRLRMIGVFQPEDYAYEYFPDGRAPVTGQVMVAPGLAQTFRDIAEGGADAFYQGHVAEAIAERVQEAGGRMAVEDLAAHRSTWEEPISTVYHGARIYECPPNGQGLAALLALNILSTLGDLPLRRTQSVVRLHAMIEAMRLAFADTRYYVADPAFAPAPLEGLLSEGYARHRAGLMRMNQAMQPPSFGAPNHRSDTVYLTAVDGQGNACSFINSLYMGFGAGLLAGDTGVILQNRGCLFSLDSDHPNRLEPGKRPYHTIIPGMITRDGELFASFGVMGGFMQPQGHLQVISALVDAGMDPQAALDRPRFCILDVDEIPGSHTNGQIAIEESYDFDILSGLANLGHQIVPVGGVSDRELFGGGQIILRDPETGVLWGGSDPRKDGAAVGY